MTQGIGGSNAASELAQLQDMSAGPVPIADRRICRPAGPGTGADASRGAGCGVPERRHQPVLFYRDPLVTPANAWWERWCPPAATPVYIAPAFELGTLQGFLRVPGEVRCWEEHENPYQLCARLLAELGSRSIGIDESTPFFIADGLRQAMPACSFHSATRGHRRLPHAQISRRAGPDAARQGHDPAGTQGRGSHPVALASAPPRSARSSIAAHRKVGAPAGSYFCIVLFGPDSAFPHGVAQPKTLDEGDMVLIDTGCQLHGYISDITRSYVFGEPTAQQREIWNLEKAAQQAAFAAAQIGAPCGSVDDAARAVLEAAGLGPDYALPGLPHRTGHGIGLDIHEWPYLVRGNDTPLAPGMCFSNEPMICVPGAFGVRHEDHFYMTEKGPRWFTQPAHSVDDPFGGV
jgi:Xaa-Pro dipeptidase